MFNKYCVVTASFGWLSLTKRIKKERKDYWKRHIDVFIGVSEYTVNELLKIFWKTNKV
jgi:hypothetical protein